MSSEGKVRGKVRVKVERNRDVNITQNGQMLNLNISSCDSFLTQKLTVPEIVDDIFYNNYTPKALTILKLT